MKCDIVYDKGLTVSNFEIDTYDKAQDLLLPWWSEDPGEVHVRHHDYCDEATEGPRYGLVLLPEKVVFKLERKKFDADSL